MSLKGHINNYARENRIAAQTVLQNLMFERFLIRLSHSEYRDSFIIKGGILVSAILGLNSRSTMDLDMTLRQLPLSRESLPEVLGAVCRVAEPDETAFSIVSVTPIRKNALYGGYRVRIDARYDTIITPLSIDITTGDIITPGPVEYELRGIFDGAVRYSLWGYNIETLLAEKLETLLMLGVFNTRPRDFYDIYVLTREQPCDHDTLMKALALTAARRGHDIPRDRIPPILDSLRDSREMREHWEKYTRRFPYASGISYTDVILQIRECLLTGA